MKQNPEDIRERSFRFALNIIKVCETIPSTRTGNILAKQLVRAGTSIGANAEEALAAHSKNDFVYKNNIALKEARETHYWIRLIQAASLVDSAVLGTLREESNQIMRIFGAIVSKSRKHTKSIGEESALH
jgi:four helix bundle protein